MKLDHPIDALGKLRIADADIDSTGYCNMTAVLCHGSANTILTARRGAPVRIFSHIDFVSQNEEWVKQIIEEYQDELVKYVEHLFEMNYE